MSTELVLGLGVPALGAWTWIAYRHRDVYESRLYLPAMMVLTAALLLMCSFNLGIVTANSAVLDMRFPNQAAIREALGEVMIPGAVFATVFALMAYNAFLASLKGMLEPRKTRGEKDNHDD